MKKAKKLFVLVLALTIVMSFTACSTESSKSETDSTVTTEQGETKKTDKASAEDITLRLVWAGDGSSKEKLDSCIVPFTEETGINVETVYIPGSWAEYLTKIQTMIAGGDVVDNAWIAIEGMQNFISTGLGLPLTEYAETYKEEYEAVTNDMDPKIIEPLSVDGEVYALPWDWNNMVMHCNVSMFEEAGVELPTEDWDKEDFLDSCEKLTKEVDGQKQYAVAVPDFNFAMEAWIYNNGGAFMTDDFTKSLINQPESVEMFQLWQDLVYKYGYAPIPEKNVNVIQQMIDGNVAMFSAGRWPSFNYTDNNFTDAYVQYLPSFKQNQPIAGIGGIFVLKGTEHYDEAATLSTYIASPTFIEQFLSAGSIPALKSVAEKIITPESIPLNGDNVYYPSIKIGKAVHAPIQYPQCEDIVNRAFSEIMLNQADVQTTLDAAAHEMDAVLAQNDK